MGKGKDLDWILKYSASQTKFNVEVEVNSKSFVSHQHPLKKVDFIICLKHDWFNCPIPVIDMGIGYFFRSYALKRMCMALMAGRHDVNAISSCIKEVRKNIKDYKKYAMVKKIKVV